MMRLHHNALAASYAQYPDGFVPLSEPGENACHGLGPARRPAIERLPKPAR
jgi:hypothetical protein